MKKTQNPYSAELRKLAIGQTANFARNNKSEVALEINRLNNERNPYEYTTSLGKNGYQVTRKVPTNLFDRKMYIDSITKSQLQNSLRSNNWSKEATGRDLGISARSIGRMIDRHNITASTSSKATSTRKATTSKTKATSRKRA